MEREGGDGERMRKWRERGKWREKEEMERERKWRKNEKMETQFLASVAKS